MSTQFANTEQGHYEPLQNENEASKSQINKNKKYLFICFLISAVLLSMIALVISLLLLTTNTDSNNNNEIWLDWSNTIPPNSIPFEKSTDIIGWQYLNNSNFIYGGSFDSADTWYPSWANNGNLYTTFTAGTVSLSNGIKVTSNSVGIGSNLTSSTGYAVVSGQKADNLTIIEAAIFTSSSYPYEGRYPCGSLIYNNTWFYGTCFLNGSYGGCGSVCLQGPLVGYRWTDIEDIEWNEPRLKCNDAKDNLFHESGDRLIKFGAPQFVDFGDNLQYSPDGKAYIIAHGVHRNGAIHTWIQADEIYIARVQPNVAAINDNSLWEFYVGNDEWEKGNVSNAKPILIWNERTGSVTMTYFQVLRKYIMVISTPHSNDSTKGSYDTYLLESNSIVGPWKYIIYLQNFGPQAYYVSHPSKFIGSSILNGNYFGSYLSYTANWGMDRGVNNGTPIGSGYHWSLQQTRFKLSTSFV